MGCAWARVLGARGHLLAQFFARRTRCVWPVTGGVVCGGAALVGAPRPVPASTHSACRYMGAHAAPLVCVAASAGAAPACRPSGHRCAQQPTTSVWVRSCAAWPAAAWARLAAPTCGDAPAVTRAAPRRIEAFKLAKSHFNLNTVMPRKTGDRKARPHVRMSGMLTPHGHRSLHVMRRAYHRTRA